ncbi:MAG: 2,3,4,5-tetrahydropyridine-2,6-dicarboxylate N-succinyltransferase [Gammaproteobacteria bacterium]|nr:2,3,4,5-tetrahydropyridine-2,6-dicarboxylate N-succinyltransferase [Gammaproteobacteria bacterium]
MHPYQQQIEDAFAAQLTQATPALKQAIDQVIQELDQGKLRVAEKIDGSWQVHEWLKKAILLFFRFTPSSVIEADFCQFYDKVPLKYTQETTASFAESQVRVVPHAMVRKGAYIGPQTVLMPSYINIGAYVDSGTLIDTWATVGSCAQIGKNVHLSGGAGIGGVLEPIQAQPTIIEDHCFIGARSEIVEGVIVETGSVISMGVFIGQSTKIYHRETGEIFYGRVPAGSVVVPGSLPSKDGTHSLYAAIIIKQVDLKTKQKTGLNELLRMP